MSEMQLKFVPWQKLEYGDIRDIRQNTVERIKERIKEDGYDPSNAMRVVREKDEYIVADGNHRLKALSELPEDEVGVQEVPCVVETTADIIAVTVESNKNESTFAEQDLFDYLGYIDRLRDEHTQAEIGEELGWSRSKVNNYTSLASEVDTGVLALARSHQEGRVSSDDTAVSFSEYWFRTSDLYNLNREGVDEYALPDEDNPRHAQMRVMRWFCEEKSCDATKNAVQNKVEEVKETCELLDILNERLEASVSEGKRQDLRDEVIEGVYTKDTIDGPIENANKEAKDRAIYGRDCREVLTELEANSVDCVVTDPPYGIDYEKIREAKNADFDDSAGNAFDVLETVCKELQRVCKANAHLYLFFSMSEYETVKEIASRYFEVESTPLIWVKNNHTPRAPGSGGFETGYAQKYEPIMFCRMENGNQRTLNGGVSPNTLEHSRPTDKRHQTQKPRSLLKELIKNSTGKGERILDPFAGSGSTLTAAKELERHYVGIELDGEYESGFRREINEVGENGK